MSAIKCPRCGRRLAGEDVRCACGFSYLTDVLPMPFAGFWIRFLADVYDGLIALALALPVYFFFDKPVLDRTEFLRIHSWKEIGLSETVVWLAFLYNMTYLVSKTGQSIGRRLVGITVTDAKTGEYVGFLRTLGR